ncbi:MAG: hypothetical protein QUS11_07465 [Candidatus Fermentibacter sp.]|nr:hypothetical protein [Candidatus Fermentibacter sp.]
MLLLMAVMLAASAPADNPAVLRDAEGVLYDNETFSAIPSRLDELFGFSPTEPSAAGTGTWTGSGPWGGNVRAIAALPGSSPVLVAGCGYSMAPDAGGVWRSTDGGQTWQETDLQAIQVNSVCNGGSALPNTFFASTRIGLYRSDDQGQTWGVVSGGMSSSYVLLTGVHWTDPDILVAGLSSGQGIRRSTDGGATWSSVGLDAGFLKGYGFCTGHPDTMFIAMSGLSNSVYRSYDAGATWAAVGPSGSGWGILTSPGGSEGTVIVTNDGGFYLSTNYGGSWTQVVSGTSYAPAVWSSGTLYAPVNGQGVFESTNGGSTWTLNPAGITASYWQAACPGSQGYLAGHNGGVYRRLSSGSYTVSQQGMTNGFIHAVAFLQGEGVLLAGGEAHGLWRSGDGGATWELASNGLGNWTVYDICPESHDQYTGSTIYAATASGVFRSDDLGDSWASAGLTGQQVTAVAFDPSDADRAWAGIASGGIRYTTDGGATWLTSSGLPGALYPAIELGEAPGGGLRVFASFQQLGTAVYYSDDGGASFTAGSGLSGSYMPCISYCWDGTSVYCGTDLGVYRSLDSGATWSLCPGSTGLMWSVLGSRNANVLAGTNTAGVKWSPDGGDSWQALDDGIEGRCVWDIAYGGSDTQLFAGLRGFGVKELSSDALGIEGGVTQPGMLSVVASPSPSAGAVSFVVSGLDGPAVLSIFDGAGRLLHTTPTGSGAAASWEPGADTPSGIYLAMVRSGDASASARFVILR